RPAAAAVAVVGNRRLEAAVADSWAEAGSERRPRAAWAPPQAAWAPPRAAWATPRAASALRRPVAALPFHSSPHLSVVGHGRRRKHRVCVGCRRDQPDATGQQSERADYVEAEQAHQ